MPKPDLKTVPEHLHEEINLVAEDDLKKAFSTHADAIAALKDIPESKWNHRYAEGKWSIRGVIQHLIDAERIFCNRALVIARKDTAQPLFSFEEKDYEVASKADKRTKEDLISELAVVQQSSRKMFESFDDEQLQARGTVNNYTIDVNALGFVIIGHTLHHLKIIRERYL